MDKKLKKKILIVEDEKHIAEGLKLNLCIQGYDTTIADNGISAIQTWKETAPDLIILDIMLPGMDGISVLRNIRIEDERLPILILSAKANADDKVKGLSHGVDDYMTKPFNLQELLLRVERLITRASWHEPNSRDGIFSNEASGLYKFGRNKIDFESSTAWCNQGEIRLTDQETRLMKLFISNKGKTLERKKILEIGWGYSSVTTTRTVDNFIVRLRKYFEQNPKKPVYFKSIRSVGYIFDHE